MKITGTQTFPAPRQKVWEFLTDPQRIAKCLPGCEKLEAVGENVYSSQINVGLAAVKGVYTGKVKLEDMQPPSHYKMLIDGKGKQGFIKGAGTLDFEDQNGQTLLNYTGDIQVGGPLASVGQRMIDGAAKMMIGQFFTAMEAEIKATPGEEVRQGAAVNFWRYFIKLVREKLTALFGRKTTT
jgi:carbon monoxide dehydrogenase subunit G